MSVLRPDSTRILYQRALKMTDAIDADRPDLNKRWALERPGAQAARKDRCPDGSAKAPGESGATAISVSALSDRVDRLRRGKSASWRRGGDRRVGICVRSRLWAASADDARRERRGAVALCRKRTNAQSSGAYARHLELLKQAMKFTLF
jgi:hypothetical protein